MSNDSPGNWRSSEQRNHSENPSEMELDGIVRDNIGWMLAASSRILQDQALSEDAVQNAFSKIHLN